MNDLWRLTATEAVGKLRKRELSPLEMVEAAAAHRDRRAKDQRVRSKNRNCRKDSEFSIPGVASVRRAGVGFFGKSIANQLASRTNGLGAHSGLRHGDGGPGAAGADRISSRRKSDLEGPIEGAAEAVGRRASHVG